jgi:hypothetical protein
LKKERERKSNKNKKEKKEKEKLQESLQVKRGSQYFERRKILQLQNPFLYEPIFFPSIIPFQKSFPKSFDKILQLFLDHPLTWQYT